MIVGMMLFKLTQSVTGANSVRLLMFQLMDLYLILLYRPDDFPKASGAKFFSASSTHSALVAFIRKYFVSYLMNYG